MIRTILPVAFAVVVTAAGLDARLSNLVAETAELTVRYEKGSDADTSDELTLSAEWGCEGKAKFDGGTGCPDCLSPDAWTSFYNAVIPGQGKSAFYTAHTAQNDYLKEFMQRYWGDPWDKGRGNVHYCHGPSKCGGGTKFGNAKYSGTCKAGELCIESSYSNFCIPYEGKPKPPSSCSCADGTPTDGHAPYCQATVTNPAQPTECYSKAVADQLHFCKGQGNFTFC